MQTLSKLFLLGLLLSLGLVANVHAQPQDFAFERVRLPGGSTQNFVTAIAQDPQGWNAPRTLIRVKC